MCERMCACYLAGVAVGIVDGNGVPVRDGVGHQAREPIDVPLVQVRGGVEGPGLPRMRPAHPSQIKSRIANLNGFYGVGCV
jgi:hypothetical protein